MAGDKAVVAEVQEQEIVGPGAAMEATTNLWTTRQMRLARQTAVSKTTRGRETILERVRGP